MATSAYQYLDVSKKGDVIVARFKQRHLLVDEVIVQCIGAELFELAEGKDRPKLIVDFVGVLDLCSLMLGKLVTLRKKMAANRGQLVLCGLSPEVWEYLDETMLSQLFEIRATEAERLRRCPDASPKRKRGQALSFWRSAASLFTASG